MAIVIIVPLIYEKVLSPAQRESICGLFSRSARRQQFRPARAAAAVGAAPVRSSDGSRSSGGYESVDAAAAQTVGGGWGRRDQRPQY
jgi:hypothetical protein